MKVSEQISLLLSGKVTYDQLKELKEEEKVEKDNPEEKSKDNPEEKPKENTEEKPKDNPEEKPKDNPEEKPEDSKLKEALEQVEALTKQVEDLQKKNTQKDIEDKTCYDKFDMTEFVKNFRG